MYVTKSAQELLFDGYQDDLIDIAIEMSLTDKTVTVPYDKFGWFYTVSKLLSHSIDMLSSFRNCLSQIT